MPGFDIHQFIQDRKSYLLGLGREFYNSFGRGVLVFEVQPDVQTQASYRTEELLHNESSLTPEQQQWVLDALKTYNPQTEAIVLATLPPAQQVVTVLIQQ